MYISFYGFSAKPFQLSPDPRFFFGSSVHKRALAYLRYGLSQGEGFIVITGGIGTGKTTLVHSLFSELDKNNVIAAQLVTTQLEADDLLRMVVAAFGLPHKDLSKAVLIKHFEDFLKACARDGKRILLVVDEAQNLPERSLEELRMLSNFQVGDAPLLQSFLLGQEEFRTSLQAPGMEQLCQRVIASCHLNPLSEAETAEYIKHRLHVVGWQGDPEFTEDALAAIHHYTEGVPRRVNVFCDRLLLYGFLEELHTFTDSAVRTVGDEFDQEMYSSRYSSTREIISSPLANSNSSDFDERFSELERSVAALILEPGLQDVRLERLEKRIVELETAIKLLRTAVLEPAKQTVQSSARMQPDEYKA